MRIFSLKCRELVEFLDRYLDGELPSEQAREFRWHLRLCRSCRAYLKTYRETLRLERAALSEPEPSLEMPEELVAAIVATIRS